MDESPFLTVAVTLKLDVDLKNIVSDLHWLLRRLGRL